MNPRYLLEAVIAVAEREGERLAQEFYLPRGPRGRHFSAPIDLEIEHALRASLQALCPCRFAGEETGSSPAPAGAAPDSGLDEWLWMVDPHDGTYEFLRGRRGSAISVALLRGRQAVLAVVHSPLAPDAGPDTISWAEGISGILRNGKLLAVDLSRGDLSEGERVFAPASSAQRPQTWSRALAPARYVAMPSIAYRLARVAAGDAAATLTVHPVNEYDIAAGWALVRAARGVLHDAAGEPIELKADPKAQVSGCFAGAPAAVMRLRGFDWKSLEREERCALRIETMTLHRRDEPRLSRAQGALLGLVLGDTLVAQPRMVHDKRAALLLARRIARIPYPGLPSAAESESAPASSLAALLRVLPVALRASPDWELAARTASAYAAHAGAAAEEAAAACAAAVAIGIAGAKPSRMLQGALDCVGSAALRSALRRAAAGEPPKVPEMESGHIEATMQNAFCQLLHATGYREAVSNTIRAGGASDLNAALAGALYCAGSGKEAVPLGSVMDVLAWRSHPGAAETLAEVMAGWPDDLLELAEALALGMPPVPALA